MAKFRNIHLKKLSAEEIASLEDLPQILEELDQNLKAWTENLANFATFVETLSQENSSGNLKKKLLKVSNKIRRVLGKQA